ncbi:Uncharacterised protein [Klebsiella pneumoniae]|uniref:Uncharacterized protein n=1 Tax=Klebsiella pneumoniae TaxID=573 RepID=A0A2X1Q5M4_KLEPN|nr:Uncharacterised protein [Klebsiella pneumoniae]
MDRHTLPTKIIHYSQRPETSSVKQVIRHEIHTSALIDTGQDRTLLTMCCTDMPAGALFAQVEAFQTVNPVCFLVVNRPVFPPQLNMNTRATVADPVLIRKLKQYSGNQKPVSVSPELKALALKRPRPLLLLLAKELNLRMAATLLHGWVWFHASIRVATDRR